MIGHDEPDDEFDDEDDDVFLVWEDGVVVPARRERPKEDDGEFIIDIPERKRPERMPFSSLAFGLPFQAFVKLPGGAASPKADPMKHCPTVVGCMLCEAIIQEERTRNVSLINCFTIRQAPSVPTTAVEDDIRRAADRRTGEVRDATFGERTLDA